MLSPPIIKFISQCWVTPAYVFLAHIFMTISLLYLINCIGCQWDNVMYKILILTCIHGLAPLHLQELIQEYKPTQNLRSSSKLKRVSATVSILTYGHGSFYIASAELCNNLQMHVKNCQTVCQFKSSLKTHLLKFAFYD